MRGGWEDHMTIFALGPLRAQGTITILRRRLFIRGLVCVYSGDTVSHNLTSYMWVPAAAYYANACTDGLCIDLRAFNPIV